MRNTFIVSGGCLLIFRLIFYARILHHYVIIFYMKLLFQLQELFIKYSILLD